MHDDTWANFCEIHYESEVLLLTLCINFYGTRKCVCTSSNIEKEWHAFKNFHVSHREYYIIY